MPGVESVEPRVQNQFLLAFNNVRSYLNNIIKDFNIENGLLVRDEMNILKMSGLIDELHTQMEMLGYRSAVINELEAMAKIVEDVKQEFIKRGYEDSFTTESETSIRALLLGTDMEMTGVAGEASNKLGQILRRAVVGSGRIEDLIYDISKQLDTELFRVKTMVTTALQSFQQMVRVQHATDLGFKWFAYLGPQDSINRDWCSHWVNRRGTIKMFEDTIDMWGREKQPSPISIWSGGWNCRHELRPIGGDQLDYYEVGPR